ncbi:MAG: tRNA (N6-threonylcarbamoyladenosine(37)-N6)-methyltransferase TrmO [Archangiaceae bacterium]|nr:tRNA (N6-threonylcarbamoyladenosine(37)-N6)-methyltransferase TrmO [Archangiaceae bacterium]
MYTLTPIAVVRGGRTDLSDDHWGAVQSTIELAPEFPAESLAGLEACSHLEVVFVFHRVDEASIVTSARHPRERQDWPRVGIFAQRGKARPNRLGVSRCRLLRVDGRRLHVEGLDAIDGTPVVDLKPWLREFGPIGEVRQPAWSTELMQHYYDR